MKENTNIKSNRKKEGLPQSDLTELRKAFLEEIAKIKKKKKAFQEREK
ncbi:MAG: hypothetical protein GF308_09680 [Candidatus Heimdallarchaeota archaeon]|nr:hypothetical protein [Candidatus Heimdallarchaeota archaeon]